MTAHDLPWGVYTGNRSPFNSGIKPVYASYKRFKVIFIADQRWSTLSPWWEVVILGHPHIQVGAATLDDAKLIAEEWAGRLHNGHAPQTQPTLSFDHMQEFIS